jgi:hypothetical protein
MQNLTYLSKIAQSGSLLAWDGKKIVPADSLESNVVWKWNEKDVSQFKINLDTIHSGSLSVSNTSWGPSLRVDFKENNSENGAFIFSISDFNFQSDEFNRYYYTIKFRLCNFSGIAKDWQGIGITFLSNNEENEKYFSLGNVCNFSSQNVKATKVDSGTLSISTESPPGPKVILNCDFGRPVTTFEHEIVAVKNSDSIGFQNSWSVKNSSTTLTTAAGLDETFYCSAFGNFKSNWFSQELNSCGFILLGTSNASAAHFNIDSIEIIKNRIN